MSALSRSLGLAQALSRQLAEIEPSQLSKLAAGEYEDDQTDPPVTRSMGEAAVKYRNLYWCLYGIAAKLGAELPAPE